MRKIFKSRFIARDESGDQITVFALDNTEEYWKLDDMSHEERCSFMNVTDESLYPYAIPPGALYHHYSFDLFENFFIMIETVSLNA